MSANSASDGHMFLCVTLHLVCGCLTFTCSPCCIPLVLLLLLLPSPSSANMEPGDIRDMMSELTSTAVDMTPGQLDSLHRACSVIEQITASQCRDIISSAGSRACLLMFMSDGWATDIRKRFRDSCGEVSVQRTGRLRTEFIVQRTIVKALIGSDMQMAMKIERPRPLANKKCADVWSAACDTSPLLKLAGHSGISVSIYLQDGLFARPFGRRMIARHNLFFKPDLCPLSFESAADRELAEYRDWVLTWTCCAHSCSRALKWGLSSLVLDKDFLEGVHITMSSLLRASSGILSVVPEFIISCVAYDRPDPIEPGEIEHLWTLLDVDPTHIELFLRVNPSWDGSILHVSSSLLGTDDHIRAITTVVRYCMRWSDFSETRWTKVGEVGRLYLRSLLVGVDGLVKMAEANDAISKWHLNGYSKRSSPSVRLYLCAAAAAAAGRPTSCMLFELM